ncbi:transposase [Metabacillus arenae]|uniref:Transposase n=1 Tax=Metabacillus arenae TaxID=2771434 RepID=A0A926RZE3_9BACI|nr:transposase [Metabacillus arenae]MBD1383026.1 transposase [Metabacillus arenae]
MARKLRVWYPGAMYHITARGNRRNVLYYDDQDYLKYLSLLAVTRSNLPFLLHSYCLMPNHLHLQLETIDFPIQSIMHDIHSKYARYFNRRYDLVGHVFQGRYGAKLIDDRDYFMKVSRYIHLNPLEASIVDKLEEYKWSSYRSYMKLDPDNQYVNPEKTLSLFYNPQEENFKKFVLEKVPGTKL